MIKLGSEVKDTVTGFKGVVVGRSEFLNGCTRIGVQPKALKDGKCPDISWFDEPQLEITKENVVQPGPRNTGGPIPSTPTRNKGM